MRYFLSLFIVFLIFNVSVSAEQKIVFVDMDKLISVSKPGSSIFDQLQVINDKHLTLRTSVVGPELKCDGEELFHWFMNQTDEIIGFTEAIWSGVTTIELAKAVKWSIDYQITGLYHVSNNSSISKYDLLQLFKKYTKKEINIEPSDRKSTDKSFIDTRLLLNYKIPSYDKMIFEMIELIKNKKLYNQYKV